VTHEELPHANELKGNAPSDSQIHLYAEMMRTERVSGSPIEGLLERAKLNRELESELREELSTDSDPTNWPYTTVYFMPNGNVEVEHHSTRDDASRNNLRFTQAFIVMRVKHSSQPSVDLPNIRFLKFRAELGPFMESAVAGFMGAHETEHELMRKMFPHIEGNH
jgi:hypothetical protein